MNEFALIVNPASGGGAAPAVAGQVATHLRTAGAGVEVSSSSSAAASLELADRAIARGFVVVSVGGDGTLSSLAGRVAERGGTFALAAAGRGNDFARMLGLPSDPAAIAARLLSATPRPVDLLEVRVGGQSRWVAGSLYAGVDSTAAELVNRMRRVPRPAQYPLAALRALATYRPFRYRLSIDDQAREVEAATVVVANSGYYGDGMLVAPAAAVDDGLLDVVVIGAASRRAMIRALPRIYRGTHVDLPQVQTYRGRSVELSATPTVLAGGDGEPLGALPAVGSPPARIDLRPGALRVLR